jgi:hypothetical protein
MMCGGGRITDWMIGEVVIEDEDEEGLDSTEGVICDFAVGDITSGVQGCKMVGSKMIPVTKLLELVLISLCWEKVSESGF